MAGRGPANGEPVATQSRPKRAHYLIALGMGATIGFVAAFGETLYAPLTFPALFFSQSLIPVIIAVTIAPLVEEPSKTFGLLLLKEEEKLTFDLAGWTVLGSLAGIGFGLMENVVYAISVASFGLNVSLTLFVMRGLLTAPLHGITATLTGFGIGLWQQSTNSRFFLATLIVAMMIHGSFNLLASVI